MVGDRIEKLTPASGLSIIVNWYDGTTKEQKLESVEKFIAPFMKDADAHESDIPKQIKSFTITRE